MADNILTVGVLKGMEDLGCKLVKLDGNKAYYEIPSSFTQSQIDKMKYGLDMVGIKLFSKRV